MLCFAYILFCFYCSLSFTAGSSCSGCMDLTRTPEANGTSVVLTTVRLIQRSGIFEDDYKTLQRIAELETQNGTNQLTYRPRHHGGIWNLNETGFNSLKVSTRLKDMIQVSFCINWDEVTWTDLRKPLHSALAARLLMHQVASGALPSLPAEQANIWISMYNSTGKTQGDYMKVASMVNENEEIVVPKSIDIGSATAFSFPSNELKYFSFNASNDTSSLYKITLSVTAGTAFLYISNVGVPSEFLHCSKIEETSSTGYVYLSTTQLSSCGLQEVIIGIAGKGASMIEGSLTVSDAQDSYNYIQNIGSDSEWFAIGMYSNHPDAGTVPLSFLVTSDTMETFNVSVESHEGSILVGEVKPYKTTEFFVPETFMVSNDSDYLNGLIVRASDGNRMRVSVSNHHYLSSDSYLALPLIEYEGVSEYTYFAVTPNFTSPNLKSRVLIVCGFNDTQITITASQSSTLYLPSGTMAIDSSTSVNVTGQMYETIFIESEDQLMGTKVVTNKPVTFLSGHQCAALPDSENRSCDFSIEQLPPTINWGRNFIFPLLSSRTGGSYLSILASQGDTNVNISCSNFNGSSTLTDSIIISAPGDFATMLVAPDDALCSVVADKPSLLTVLSTSNGYDSTVGDPLMVLLHPMEQYSNVNYSFTAHRSDISDQYLNLMVKDGVDDVLLNDMPVMGDWKSISDIGGSRAGYAIQLSLPNTTHTVSVRNGARVGGMVYGFDCSVGYGQLTATNLYLIPETPNTLSASVTIFGSSERTTGDNVKLTCSTTGLPVYAIHWTKEGSLIYPSCKHSVSSTSPVSSILTVYNISEADAGVYACVAYSYYSEPETARSQSLSAANPPTDTYTVPVVTPAESSMWQLKNGSRTLAFTVTNAVPNVTSNHFWWHFRSSGGHEKYLDPMVRTKYVISSDHLSLEVMDSKLNDAGNYTLIVSNEAGVSNNTIFYSVYIAPKIIDTTPGTYTRNTTNNMAFNCTAGGYPRPTIEWTKDDQTLTNSVKVAITSRYLDQRPDDMLLVTSTLTLSDLNHEADSGNYKCRASNLVVPRVAVLQSPFILNVSAPHQVDHCRDNPCQHGGTCSSRSTTFSCACTSGYTGERCQIATIVFREPTFTVTPIDTTGEIDSSINLTCRAVGSPTPTILWYKDGQHIVNNNDDGSVLKIAVLRLEDRGYYHCVARALHDGVNYDKNSSQVLVKIEGIVQYETQIPKDGSNSSSIEQKVRIALINMEDFPGNTTLLLVETLDSTGSPNFKVIVTLKTDQKPSSALRNSLSNHLLSRGVTLALVERFDGCSPDVTIIPPHTNKTELNVTINWPETDLGSEARVRCPCGDDGVISTDNLFATRSCQGDYRTGGIWVEPIVAPCNFSDFAREICELTILEVPKRVQGLNNLTGNENYELDSTDVTVVTLILLTTTETVKGDLPLTESYLKVVDNVISVDTVVLTESQTVSNTSAKILGTIDSILAELPIPDTNEPVIITFEKLAASAIGLETEDFEGLVFRSDTNNSRIGEPEYGTENNVSSPTIVSIVLQSDLFDNITNVPNATRIINKVFLNDALFLRRKNNYLNVHSPIVSASVVNVPISDLANPINISFPASRQDNQLRQSCVFWDPSLDGGYGDWSTRGCYGGFNDDISRACHCDHLTNFAILLDVSPRHEPTEDNSPADLFLEAFTYIGIIISIVCILITLFTYTIAKKLRKRSSGQLIINLCLALLGLYISFIVAVHSRHFNILCAIVALVLQYFFLVTFLAMGCESVILYRELVIIVGERKSGVAVKAALVCWVLPLFVVAFCFAPNYKHYIHNAFCRAFDIPFYIGTVAPFILIYIFNFIVFTIIIISLLKRGQSSATKLPGHIYVKQQLGVAISLSVLFGISWGIGLFASRRIYSGSDRIARDVIAAIFIILTAFHGLILFLMHCVRPAKVREEVRSVFFDRSKKTRTTSGAIQKDKLTKHAAYTTTFDKRGSYDTAMFPPQRSSGSLSSIKKNDDSMMMSNYYTIREEETGFASNPDFVNGESPDHKGINGDSQAGKVNLSCSNDSHEVHVPLNDDQPMLDNCSPVQA